MYECAERKCNQPDLTVTSVKVKTNRRNNNEEKKLVCVYPALAECFLEEILPYRFIDNIRQKRADNQNPDIYIL